MKVSIITITLNSAKTVERTLLSVQQQTYGDIEHIVIDGASTDGTMEIVNHYASRLAQVVSEPDNGLYDALNKGLALATGDIIGILNSDDVLADESTIATIVSRFVREQADLVYGDLLYCRDTNKSDSVIRYWRSNIFREKSLKCGWMPPHPTLYCRRNIYEIVGLFNSGFRISADYDLILRIFSHSEFKKVYLPNVIVKMSAGGVSNRNLHTILLKSREDLRAVRSNHIGGLCTILCKNFRKIGQFFR